MKPNDCHIWNSWWSSSNIFRQGQRWAWFQYKDDISRYWSRYYQERTVVSFFVLGILLSSKHQVPSSLWYKTHLSGQLNCRSLRCSWSIACRRCSNYIFILDLTPGFKGLGKDDFKTRWESFQFCDLVCLILETLRSYVNEPDEGQTTNFHGIGTIALCAFIHPYSHNLGVLCLVCRAIKIFILLPSILNFEGHKNLMTVW